jgi:glucose-1-phosphate adenylyltransferase
MQQHRRRDETLCLILAGGVGKRLYPLTADRSKPSVPFGGKYRIIDFTLSNCLHSGVRRVLVLTQYKSHSLQKHLRDGWSIFNPEIGEYVTTVPPQMRTGDSWYSGTADAIYQNRYLIERSGARRILILSGDHIYRMDYAAMLNHHHRVKADISVACMVVPATQASGFGVMEVDESDRIGEFVEKPSSPKTLPGDPNHALASMGIYVFDADMLCEALVVDHHDPSSSHDFGKDLLPRLIKSHRAFGYRFGGELGRVTPDNYWRDVGTIDAYYEANMDLLKPIPPLDLYQDSWSIRTYQAQHPPARVVPDKDGNHGEVHNSILAGGSVVIGAKVTNSILSPRVTVEAGAVIDSSILLDSVRVGAGAVIKRCIIDKDVDVPPGMQIGVDPSADATWFEVSPNGIVTVPERFSWQKAVPLRDVARA